VGVGWGWGNNRSLSNGLGAMEFGTRGAMVMGGAQALSMHAHTVAGAAARAEHTAGVARGGSVAAAVAIRADSVARAVGGAGDGAQASALRAIGPRESVGTVTHASGEVAPASATAAVGTHLQLGGAVWPSKSLCHTAITLALDTLALAIAVLGASEHTGWAGHGGLSRGGDSGGGGNHSLGVGVARAVGLFRGLVRLLLGGGGSGFD